MALGLEERATQLWGSVPAATIEEGVRDTLDIVGEHLALGMSDCELGGGEDKGREDWIVYNVLRARDIPGVELTHDGDLSSYEAIPVHRLAGRLRSERISLGYYNHARLAAPIIRQEVERIGRPDLGLWVGVAEGKQVPSFSFPIIKMPGRVPDLPLGGLLPKYYQPYVDATNREIRDMYKDPGLTANPLVVSIESPGAAIATLQMWRMAPKIGRLAANKFARDIASHVECMPTDATVAVHLCWGRFQGEAFDSPDPSQPNALEPLVALANAVQRHWPKGHAAPALMGLPLTAEGTPMPTDLDYLKPLKQLELSEETRIGAGIITPQTHRNDLIGVVHALDKITKRIVTPTAPCGLSSLRHSPDKDLAKKVLRMHADLVDSTRV